MIDYLKVIDINDEEHNITINPKALNAIRFEITSDVDNTISYNIIHDVSNGDIAPTALLEVSNQLKALSLKTLIVSMEGMIMTFDIENFYKLYNFSVAKELPGVIASEVIMNENIRIINVWR